MPTIVFPDGSILVEPSNAELAAKLGLSAKAQNEFYDLIVIGDGVAGLTAALYAARKGIETLIIEKSSVGGQNCQSNHRQIRDRSQEYPKANARTRLDSELSRWARPRSKEKSQECEKFHARSAP